MKTETKEKLHDLKERVIHPFGHKGHGETHGETRSGRTASKGNEEHVVDESAGSEYLKD